MTRVFDVGMLEDGAPYIVMELLDGIDLRAWLRQRGPMPVAVAAAMVSQASDAIGEAHRAGIVHRDLKPANLFVTGDRSDQALVKVLDLGICKWVEPAAVAADSTSGGLGTPQYMAPEQFDGAGRADARSDIWSLGVILYELVTGRTPFQGRTLEEIRWSVTNAPAPTPAEAPGEFQLIVARCLAKDPRSRFQRATELTAALALLSKSPP